MANANYTIKIENDGNGNYVTSVFKDPSTKPVSATGLKIPWVENNSTFYTNYTVNAATAAAPIAVTTSAAHGFVTGDNVFITGGTGMTNLNGTWVVTVTSSTAFTLDGSTGSGTYTSATAIAKKISKTKLIGAAIIAASNAIQADRATNG